MRILEVTHYMPPHSGGIERIAAALTDGLRARGHEVHWMASAPPAPAGETKDASRVAAWNVLEERFGVPYPLCTPSAWGRLLERVRWADVVHVHDCLYMGSVAAAAACKRAGKPLLLTQHVGYVPFGRAWDLVERLAYRVIGLRTLNRASAVVAYSEHVVEFLANLGHRGSITMIPNAVNVDRFQPTSGEVRAAARARLGIPLTARVLLSVGRLVPKKGLPLTFGVQRELAGGGTLLLAVGDGPLADDLRAVQGVIRKPFVSPEEMPLVYAAADVFLLPSRGEGLPVSVQEALLSGLPVVVSEDPSYTANLSNAPGVACASDVATLTDAVRRWLRSAPPAEAISRWARERWSADAFLSTYEATMAGLAPACAEGSKGLD